MLLKCESILTFVESLNGDNAGSKCLGIYNWDNVGLYTGTTKELPTIIRVLKHIHEEPD